MARMTLDAFTGRVAEAAGARLVALLLYGSAARERGAGSQEPGAMNTLLIVDSIDDHLFTRLSAPVRDWVSAKHPPPLVLTDQEWRHSADAFAIEYDDIRKIIFLQETAGSNSEIRRRQSCQSMNGGFQRHDLFIANIFSEQSCEAAVSSRMRAGF